MRPCPSRNPQLYVRRRDALLPRPSPLPGAHPCCPQSRKTALTLDIRQAQSVVLGAPHTLTSRGVHGGGGNYHQRRAALVLDVHNARPGRQAGGGRQRAGQLQVLLPVQQHALPSRTYSGLDCYSRSAVRSIVNNAQCCGPAVLPMQQQPVPSHTSKTSERNVVRCPFHFAMA